MNVTSVLPLRIVSITLAVALSFACSPVVEPPQTSAPVSSSTPSASGTIVATGDLVTTNAARVTPQGDAQRAAAGVQSLAVDLYKQLATKQTNLVFSPYSVAIALAMTRIGAKGETAQQMDLVLHASQVGDLDAAFNALDQALAKRPGSYPLPGQQKTVPLELATANRLFAQRGFAFLTPFLDRVSAYYGASVGIVDYVHAREAARKAINDWVSERTKTRIPELIKQGVLNELTRLVLTNAVYMKATWRVPFDPALTTAGAFQRVDGTTVPASLMHAPTSAHAYARGATYQAVALPYAGGLSMVIIVPDSGAFTSWEKALDGQSVSSIVGAMRPASVDLRVPKFQFRTATSLADTLATLGMPIAFTDRADLSGISTQDRLRIQDVVHEAFVSVDESGTEAAAATAVVVGLTAAPAEIVSLTIDRPFLFLVRDDETGAILFMGRVLDPS